MNQAAIEYLITELIDTWHARNRSDPSIKGGAYDQHEMKAISLIRRIHELDPNFDESVIYRENHAAPGTQKDW
jgi:hypothetical protein